jgi:arginine N-succinyltransferase
VVSGQELVVFVIRRAKPEDTPTLVKLARMAHFINLPPDREIIDEKVAWSRQCFLMAAEMDEPSVGADSPPTRGPGRSAARGRPTAGGTTAEQNGMSGRPRPSRDPRATPSLAGGLRELTGRSPLFMFVMEQLSENAGVVGSSQIISQMGGPGAPNVSLQLARKEMFSESLQIGVTHTIATMHLDETGPTEVGGLILQPSLRGHRLKLGRLLSYARFHFMGLHRSLFSDRVLAEMMGVISSDGRNPFWEYFARCFINLSYEQADRFCQQSKEFILSLFPREPIYLSLIAPEARAVVGQVGPETAPAKRMLERLGFRSYHRVDPFDAGPHLEAYTSEISIVRDTRRGVFAPPAPDARSDLPHYGLVSTIDADGEFRAVETPYDLDRQERVVLPRVAFQALSLEPGMPAGYTPIERPAPLSTTLAPQSSKGARRRRRQRKPSP